MLRNIPEIISPDLMKIMMEMGHGDELCFGDANFPDAALARRLVRADGLTVTDLLDAVLQFFPLDTFVTKPCTLMEAPAGEEPAVWDKYSAVIHRRDFNQAFSDGFELIERFDFYARARDCFAIVATSEHQPYSNIILKKGCVW